MRYYVICVCASDGSLNRVHHHRLLGHLFPTKSSAKKEAKTVKNSVVIEVVLPFFPALGAKQ